MREKYKKKGFYTGLACDIIGLDPEPLHPWTEGTDTMAFSLLQFAIWVCRPGRDWDSFLDLGDYIDNVLEKYKEGKDLLYDARYHGDVSQIPAEVVTGYDMYRTIVNVLASHPEKGPETTEMTKYNHYQYLQIIKERYDERKRKMSIQRSSAPQFQTVPGAQGTDGETE